MAIPRPISAAVALALLATTAAGERESVRRFQTDQR